MKFDKIHCLINDIKAAEKSLKKIWYKTKLWTSYLFSINKRPFGKGGNATEKQRWMALFEVTHNINSPVFQKRVARIGQVWGMPYRTPAEQQRIFDRVLLLKSFNTHMSHPKLANWFAWNKCGSNSLTGRSDVP